MLQSILAIACFRFAGHERHRRRAAEAAGPGRPPREHDAATRLADRALCGIDLPLVL